MSIPVSNSAPPVAQHPTLSADPANFAFRHPSEALPGRSDTVPLENRHHVLGPRYVPPFPEGVCQRYFFKNPNGYSELGGTGVTCAI